MASKSSRSGFTLLELSIVLVIVAVVTAMGLISARGVMEASRRSATENKMDVIEKALMDFRLKNNRLPCPADATLGRGDTYFGMEAQRTYTNPQTCISGTWAANMYLQFINNGTGFEGAVPTKALNLPDEYMLDGWGRKIAYGVGVRAVDNDALLMMPPTNSCAGIPVNDGAGGQRTNSALYVLVSFGADGHGAYRADGLRVNTASADTDVNANCHCTSALGTLPGLSLSAFAPHTNYYYSVVPAYVQKSMTATFDHIVRYKDRWQLQTPDDPKNATLGNYNGPLFAVGTDSAANVYLYRELNSCSTILPLWNSVPIAAGVVTGLHFTPNNAHLFVYSPVGGCALYQITAGTGTMLNLGSIPSCPTFTPSDTMSEGRTAMSDNGYLAIGKDTSPYIQLWRLMGNGFVSIKGPTLTRQPMAISFSKGATHLVISGSDYATVYRRTDDTFTALATQPTGIPAAPVSVAFSPNGKYLGITEDTNPSRVHLWQASSPGAFSAMSDVVLPAGNRNPTGLTFSPDGKYMAVGTGAAGGNSSGLILYNVSPAGTFSLHPLSYVASGIGIGGTVHINFSPNGKLVDVNRADKWHNLILPSATAFMGYIQMSGLVDPNAVSNHITAVTFAH